MWPQDVMTDIIAIDDRNFQRRPRVTREICSTPPVLYFFILFYYFIIPKKQKQKSYNENTQVS